MLENAREQVVAATTPAGTGTAPAASTPTSTTSAPSELPAPDPSTFEGSNRIVNLWVGAGGEAVPVDVWARRTFTNGPVLLAEGIGFGTASDYFSAPAGSELVVVNSGAGPDGEERARLFNAVDGEQITLVFTNEDETGVVSAVNVFEHGGRSPDPPADGASLVVLAAPNLRAFSATLIESIGGDALFVGDGSAVCRPQRIEATGFPPDILGGTQQIELEVPPGPTSISLHPWFSPDECDQPSVLDLTVDAAAGDTSLVLVYSRDGTGIEAVTLPVARLTSG